MWGSADWFHAPLRKCMTKVARERKRGERLACLEQPAIWGCSSTPLLAEARGVKRSHLRESYLQEAGGGLRTGANGTTKPPPPPPPGPSEAHTNRLMSCLARLNPSPSASQTMPRPAGCNSKLPSCTKVINLHAPPAHDTSQPPTPRRNCTQKAPAQHTAPADSECLGPDALEPGFCFVLGGASSAKTSDRQSALRVGRLCSSVRAWEVAF